MKKTKQLTLAQIEKLVKEMKPVEQLKYDRKIDNLSETKKASDKKYEEARDEIEILDERINLLLAMKKQSTKKPMVIAPKKSTGHSESTALINMGDWHVDEVVEYKSVNGANEYNKDIAHRRIEAAFRNSLRLIEIQRYGVDINTCVLSLLGDFISGHIHEENMIKNQMTPIEGILFAQEHIVAGINLLLKQGKFKKIIIVCCTGNHGRTTKKIHISNRADSNHESYMYEFMKKVFEGDERVEFLIADNNAAYLDIYDKTYRFTHGDYFTYAGGVLGKGVNVTKKILAWNSANPADVDVFGHWHQLDYSKRYLINGSVIGYNPYSEKIGADFELPQQAFATINSKRGINSVWRVYLDDEEIAKKIK